MIRGCTGGDQSVEHAASVSIASILLLRDPVSFFIFSITFLLHCFIHNVQSAAGRKQRHLSRPTCISLVVERAHSHYNRGKWYLW